MKTKTEGKNKERDDKGQQEKEGRISVVSGSGCWKPKAIAKSKVTPSHLVFLAAAQGPKDRGLANLRITGHTKLCFVILAL